MAPKTLAERLLGVHSCISHTSWLLPLIALCWATMRATAALGWSGKFESLVSERDVKDQYQLTNKGEQRPALHTHSKMSYCHSLSAIYCWNHEKTTVNKTGRQIAILKYKKGKTLGQLRIARLHTLKARHLLQAKNAIKRASWKIVTKAEKH